MGFHRLGFDLIGMLRRFTTPCRWKSAKAPKAAAPSAGTNAVADPRGQVKDAALMTAVSSWLDR
jgi:hypothetical protein